MKFAQKGIKDYAIALLFGCFFGVGLGLFLVWTTWRNESAPESGTAAVSRRSSGKGVAEIPSDTSSAGALQTSLPRARLLEIIQSSSGEVTAEEKKAAFDILLGEPDPAGELGPLALSEWRKQEAGELLWRNHILARMDTLYRVSGSSDEILAELFKAAHSGSGGEDREKALVVLERLRRGDPDVEKKLVFLDRHLIRSGQTDTVERKENDKERDHE